MQSFMASRWLGAVFLVLLTAVVGVCVDPGGALGMGTGCSVVIGLMALSSALGRPAPALAAAAPPGPPQA